MRIGIVKGNFDPFTILDLQTALKIKKEKHFDLVLFELKEGKNYNERLTILKNTISPYRYLGINVNSIGEIICDENFDKGLTRNDLLEISDSTIDYVIDNTLYIEEIAKKTLSEYRFKHVKCVAELAAGLAVHYGYKYNEGLIAGYLHDITKEWDKEYHRKFIEIYRPDKIDVSPKIYHQYSAEVFTKHNFKIKNRNITSAIGNHVNGTDRSNLSRIIFCSDKVDDSRGFDNTEIKQLLYKDLNKAYTQIRNEQLEYLKEHENIG